MYLRECFRMLKPSLHFIFQLSQKSYIGSPKNYIGPPKSYIGPPKCYIGPPRRFPMAMRENKPQ